MLVLERKIADLSAEAERYQAPRINPKRFVELIKKYKYPVALTREMVREIVDKIVIHQAEGQKPNRTLQIDIYFNFIGRYDLELTETELAEKQAEQDTLARQKNEHLAEQAKAYREKKCKPTEKSEWLRMTVICILRRSVRFAENPFGQTQLTASTVLRNASVRTRANTMLQRMKNASRNDWRKEL